jgi:hypothetical protein
VQGPDQENKAEENHPSTQLGKETVSNEITIQSQETYEQEDKQKKVHLPYNSQENKQGLKPLWRKNRNTTKQNKRTR